MTNLDTILNAIELQQPTSWKRDSGNGLVTTSADTILSVEEWLIWAVGVGESQVFRVALLSSLDDRVELLVTVNNDSHVTIVANK